MTGSRVLAAGHYQPAKVLTNNDIAKIVDTSDEWIQSRVGIKTRHIADPTETVDFMAAKAAEHALSGSGLTPADIDLVITATTTAIDRSPNVAARVADTLGLGSPATIDVNVACSGFCHALATADHAIRAGAARNAIVIGAERLTDFTDWTDRTTCVLTADGAGAVVITAADKPAISPVVWGSVPSLGSAVRIEGNPGTFAQEGQAVFRWATQSLPGIAREVCNRAGITPEDLGAVVFHQANLRIIEPLARKLGAVNAVIAQDVVTSGNTSAASVPLALSKLAADKAVPSGTPTLLFGFGGGLAYAGQVIEFP
ncbi:3-oxoacyl-[acyl-carrier-protein] synthase 3 protein 4 [Lentzea sp. NBRC 105346]|uniref:beta-ketoacyl-ACP synthase III n=1 Tax=Lentzea sp. NBRC 105346 TaxID=3032205 RepID=UPI0024A2E9EE|nr:beta-ketoacyl-ACP synthase III [Lentzea sp. NBRC 105346]GLZ31953.1 3-oxoacyl-[acyl-carrier-protein] synthase 3 protein 4 [Lentzea sp. NBRC 105346]